KMAHRLHGLAELVVSLGVKARVAGDLAMCLAMIVHPPQVIAARHGCERAIERENFQSVAGQVEVANDFRSQQRHDIRADGKLESGKNFLRDRSPAKDMPA